MSKHHFDQLKEDIFISMGFTENDQAPSGFYTCYCPVCGKTSRKTGGFYFDDESIIYNCFRASCNASTVYEYGQYIPKRFRSLMETIGVSVPIELYKLSKDKINQQTEENDYFEPNYFNDVYQKLIENYPNFLTLDQYIEKFGYDRSIENIFNYLQKRRVDDQYQKFWIDTNDRNWIIVPFWFYRKFIGFQKVHLYQKRFDIETFGNKSVFYLPSGIIPQEPVIVEGIFDALTVPNGVAILSNNMNKKQAYHLKNKSPILLPDKGNGDRILKIGYQYGWRISVPGWVDKDANDAVQSLGKIAVTQMIRDGIRTDYERAQLELKLWEEGHSK